MKIFIDIGHPAHVHYFRNFIRDMEAKGHSVVITARDKEVALTLLDYYGFSYTNRGKGRRGMIGKLLYMLKADWQLLKVARKTKPDIFMSFASPYAAQVAWLMGKPHIAFDDTDHNPFSHMMYVPFSKAIMTPKVYQKDQGKYQVRFDGFMELCSLHPMRYKPDPGAEKDLAALKKEGRFVLLRFVSWEASHDIGLEGLSLEEKYALVKGLSKHARVIISSEQDLPDDLQQYAYNVNPAYMHDILREASLLVSESLTMSAEAVFLGTPSLCISTALAGTLDEEVRLGLIELYRKPQGLVERAIEIAGQLDYKSGFADKVKEVVKDKIDVTGFMEWFVENYPESFDIMKKDPDYQNRFK
ncbi:MAG: DUF354 domain-containing protein [Flavobacteriales bacterium]|nr:DUF354 domain-containing protein [Flavobacteriales bacterium]